MSFMEEAYYAWRQKITAVNKSRDMKMSGNTDLYVNRFFFFNVRNTITNMFNCISNASQYLKKYIILKYLKIYNLHIM